MQRCVLTLSFSLCSFMLLSAEAAPPARPDAPKPVIGLDLGALDRAIDPCSDFFEYACGGWMKANPIPADQARWGRFNELDERNKGVVRSILEKASDPKAKHNANDQKIGDYYAACMDEAAIDALGVGPLAPTLAQVAALKDVAELAELTAALHKEGVGVLFAFDSGQDFKDAKEVIAHADQGGLGMPDRDYYVKTDAKSVELRKAYVAHVQKMLELMGEPSAQAAADAKTVMELETELAKVSMERAERRDPEKLYHRLALADLQSTTPHFAWSKYLAASGLQSVTSLNVLVPAFFKGVEAELAAVPLEKWQAYLRWHVVHAAAPLLARAFVDENFAFYGKQLTGTPENKPRWKRCVEYTDGDLGFALGKAFVDQTFGADGKKRTSKMVTALEAAVGKDIDGLDWMTPATKKAAHAKLVKIANKIGFPDKWRDYAKLEVKRGDALGNSVRANSFELARRLNKIGKPVDRSEWEMTPPTVNAYYDPQKNDINFPAGILQPPFYANGVDDALNFGGIGAVIGHELTHGFDDEGGQFDPYGNLKNWWSADDLKAFQERGQCIADQYGSYVAVDDVKLNGKLTLGENIADNGGVRVALMALKSTFGKKTPAPKDGFTAEQRFFLAFGQIWCQAARPEELRRRATLDPHSPARYRVNGTVRNMPEFKEAFSCKADAALAKADVCRVW